MNSKQLQRLLIFYSAVGIFAISILVAILSIFPLYQQLKKGEERNLQSALRTRTLAVEEFLSRAKDITAQIASRTQAKRELESYNLNPNAGNSAAANLTRILTDALKETEDLAGITRLDQNNQLIAKVGLSIPNPLQKLSFQDSKNNQISHPIRLNDHSYLIVTTPILNSKKQQIGTDLVLFKMDRLEEIIADYTGLSQTGEIFLGAFQDEQIKLFFPSINQPKTLYEPLIKALEKNRMSQESRLTVVPAKSWIHSQVIAFEPLSKINWWLAIKIERNELYAPVNRQLITIGIVTIILSLTGASGMILLLRPLAGRAIIKADELEKQLQEKNLTLRELNYTQEQLLLEIRDRKQAETKLQKRAEQLRNHNTVLMELAQHRAVNKGDLLTAFRAITEATAKMLGVERVSIWLYDDSKTYLQCLNLYHKKIDQHSAEVKIRVRDYPAYFQAISSQDILAAPDARTDPRTEEFLEDYFNPLGIVSLLDTAIWISGEIVGILCIEQCETIQNWTPEDEIFVRSIANIISLAIEARNHQQAELALKESERMFRQLAESIDSVFWISDAHGEKIYYVSPAYERVWGRSCRQIYQQPQCFIESIHPEDRERIIFALTQIASAEYEEEYRIVKPNGEIRWIYDRGFPIANDQGEIDRVTGIATDITERKQAETALRQSEAQLREQKQQLQQAFKELQRTQTRMIQSEKMSSLGQMVAGIAHEINNPVNFIHGNLLHAENYIEDLLNLVQLYQKYYPDPPPEIEAEIETIELDFIQEDIKKLLQSMQVGTERIREIVKSLRIFSRLDEAEIKEVNLHEGIDSTLMILHNRLKAKPGYPGIEVIKEYGQLPRINCYSGQLNQVFMNILSNAIDAIEDVHYSKSLPENPCNPGCIRIKTERIADNWVQILIADNGSGMSEEVRSRLFDPFFTTKPIGKGTGLGLSISYQIVIEKHKGQIECDSILGKGTQFRIIIPIQTLL
ncbi:ATP-binding protein [Limnoraphis robusta]|uniref:histidine kinase n=1 Tax=Limnoraphis robusta CCNP1315 TaxID=3110306 RepID=A0ABU5TSZ5_9CYAN|nr:ATP-binding protein [Limnoraphis robusta]MEA5499338.1 ATP-binding protein [Limnoraphis robusta BA-68 BA1]MEA5518012.1 ATP-binding protein [Limnoraphis robusta CCNP1315]MEA5547259.1 ATP-binding protein [Limnoraphis robusta CCNP1324]